MQMTKTRLQSQGDEEQLHTDYSSIWLEKEHEDSSRSACHEVLDK